MRFYLLLALAIASLASRANAQITWSSTIIDPQLQGNTQFDGWSQLNSTNFPGYGGFPGLFPATWTTPAGSNTNSDGSLTLTLPAGVIPSGDAGLVKLANGVNGGPFFASESIYYGSFSGDVNVDGGTLAARDTTPVANLKNVVFQIRIGEAAGYDFYNHTLPTLHLNGSEQGLAPTGAVLLNQWPNGTFETPDGPKDIFINTWGMAWDLTTFQEPITQFEVRWIGVQHGQVYGLRLDQSDVWHHSAIPEPASLGAVCVGVWALLKRRRANG